VTAATVSVMRPVRPRAAGFTLVELLIALVVFGLGVLSLAAVIPLGVARSNNASQQTRASELAATCAEQVLETPYGDASMTSGAHDDVNNPYPGGYYVRWTVEDDQPIADCKRITIRVYRRTFLSLPLSVLVVVSPRAGG
jgi:prepilin-type N-terminal cleavage/methylation domain-containing protein